MSDLISRPTEHSPRTPSAESMDADDRRAFPRRPVPEIFVAVETAQDPGHPEWAGSAIDISGGGLALMLPDQVPVGSELYLTFRLDDGTAFVRVPSTVVRRDPGYCMGAVEFHDWNDGERLALLASLARN